MASEDFLRTISRTRTLLDWDNASMAAQSWWEELEALNEDRVDLVLKLADELLVRGATINDFFLACSYSGREGVQENLQFLDVINQDKVFSLESDCYREAPRHQSQRFLH